jgi:hypothetical protein
MPTQQPDWEGPLLAFGGIFTVLLGLSYGVSIYFRTPIPWFVLLIVSLVATLGLSYLRRRQRS